MKKLILSSAAALLCIAGFGQDQESNAYRRTERPKEAVRWTIDTTTTNRDTLWFDADGNRIETERSQNYRQETDTEDVENETREAAENIRNEADSTEQAMQNETDSTEQAGRQVIQRMERAGDELEQQAEKTGDSLANDAQRKKNEVERHAEKAVGEIKQGAARTGNEVRRSAEQTNEAIQSGVERTRPADAEEAHADTKNTNNKQPNAPSGGEIEVVEGKEGPENQVIYKFQGEMWYVDRETKKMVKAKESDLKDTSHKIMVHEGTAATTGKNKKSKG